MKVPSPIAFARVNARPLVLAALGAVLAAPGCGEGGGGLVDPPPGPEVASISLVTPSTTLEPGRTAQLSATAVSAAGNPLDRTFTWSSTDESRVRVSNSGMVTAVAPGAATIRAAVDGKVGEVVITVSPVAVASVEVVPNLRSVQAGDTAHLRVIARDAAGNELTGRQVTWASSDQTRAQVSTTGVVTGVSAGTATITATVGGRSGTSAITVTPGPVITVNPVSVTLEAPVGGTATATVSVTNTGGGTLTGLNGVVTYAAGQPTGWLTAAVNATTAPATLTLTANATGLVPGTYNATVTLRSTAPGVTEKAVAVTFTVSRVPIATFAVVPGSASIQVGNTVDLDAVALSASGDTLTGRAVTWTSSDTTIATVSSTGVVTGVRRGAATITAASEGKTAEATITVTPAPVAPSATTNAATGITTTSATISGTVNPNGTATVAYFQVGTSSDLSGANRSADQPVGSGTTNQTVGLVLTQLVPNTTYYYRVVATNSAGTTSGTIQSFTTPALVTAPSAPSGLGASASGTQISLSWTDNANNETGYEVYRSTTSGFAPGTGNRITTLPAGAQTYTDTGLTPGTTYYYRVAACNAAGCTPSNQASATVPPAAVAPSATTGSATNITSTSVTVAGTVNPNGTATQAFFEYGTSSTLAASTATGQQSVGAGTTVVSVTQALSTLLPATTYFFRIVATSAGGTSRGSIQSFTTPAAAVAPAAPSSLAATAVSATQINLSWTDNSTNETEFRIERKTGSGGTYAQVATVGAGATTYQDTGLSSGTTYFYRVRACNTVGCSGYSNEDSATTQQSAPAAPSGLVAAKASNGNRIELTWTDNANNETRYEVYRSTTANVTASTANRIGGDLAANTQTYIDDTVSKNVTYYYRVRACNSTGCSNLSNEDSEKL